jgi:hypothetical protein
MAGKYLNQLSGTTSISGNTLFLVYQNGETFNVTKDNLGLVSTTGGTINGGLTANTFSSTTVYVGSLNTSGSSVCVGSNGLLQQYTPTGSIIIVGSGTDSTMRCGNSNNASGNFSTISGGKSNTSSGCYSTVGGGGSNNSSSTGSTVSGGISNTSSNLGSTVGGGVYNTSSNSFSTVGGGLFNTASQDSSSVSGGRYNTASGKYSMVSGGRCNTSSGDTSTISGGYKTLLVDKFHL